MKNEKHPVYRWVLGGFIVLLVCGIGMLVAALILGDSGFLPGRARPL